MNGDQRNPVEVVSDLHRGLQDNKMYELNEKILEELSSIVSLSSYHEDYREKLAEDDRFVRALHQILALQPRLGQHRSEADEFYLRCWRAAIILTRNFSVTGIVEHSEVMNNFQNYLQRVVTNVSIFYKTVPIYIQILCNISQKKDLRKALPLADSVIFSDDKLMEIISNDCETRMILTLYLSKILEFSEDLYEILNSNNKVVPYIVSEAKLIDFDSELDYSSLCLVKGLQVLFSHESFIKWINSLDSDSELMLEVLSIAQLVITSRDTWTNYELVGLLTWLHPCVQSFSQIAQDTLNSTSCTQENLNVIHRRLFMVLDCISELGKFETTKAYLLQYNALDILISLLQAVHARIERKTLKHKNIESSKMLVFPHIKSVIIEIITFMVYESTAAQNKVRELHGIETILSNCVIDTDDPFIKERSIICLKFLLQRNIENQNLVASLEKKEDLSEKSLHEAGYEVELQDGTFKLKSTEKES